MSLWNWFAITLCTTIATFIVSSASGLVRGIRILSDITQRQVIQGTRMHGTRILKAKRTRPQAAWRTGGFTGE